MHPLQLAIIAFALGMWVGMAGGVWLKDCATCRRRAEMRRQNAERWESLRRQMNARN